MENNVLNKVIEIENDNGDTIMAIEIDNEGNIINYNECEIADIEEHSVSFDKDKDTIRLQKVEIVNELWKDSVYKRAFKNYCKDKIVESIDNDDNIVMQSNIRDYGVCNIYIDENYEDCLCFITESGEDIKTPMIDTSTFVARLEFDKIQRQLYKDILTYWDNMSMDYLIKEAEEE